MQLELQEMSHQLSRLIVLEQHYRKTDLSLAGLALASVGTIIGLIGGKERKRRKR